MTKYNFTDFEELLDLGDEHHRELYRDWLAKEFGSLQGEIIYALRVAGEMSSAKLIEWVWPDGIPDSANSSLHVALFHLRKKIAPAWRIVGSRRLWAPSVYRLEPGEQASNGGADVQS